MLPDGFAQAPPAWFLSWESPPVRPRPSPTRTGQATTRSEPAQREGRGRCDHLDLTTGEPDTIFPPNAASYSGGQVAANLCDSLLTIDADYNVRPNLATSRQVDPLTLVYTLREGVKFWDGRPVTAEDVAYSLNRGRDPSSIVSFLYENVHSVAVTGTNEVTVKFSKPDELFNSEMASFAGMVMEKDYTERAGQSAGTSTGGLMCSGPFKLDSWKPGDSIAIVRNDDYWDQTRRPFAKRVRFTFVTDGSALVQALNAGEIDGAYEIPPTAIPALRGSARGRLAFGNSLNLLGLMVTNPDGPLGDVQLRRSLQNIVDRDALAKSVYHGAATPSFTFLTPPTWPEDQKAGYEKAYDSFARDRAYNIDKAKQLVGQSKYRGQKAIQAGDETTSRTAQLIQQLAKQVGVNIEITSMTPLVFEQATSDPAKRQGIDMMLRVGFDVARDPIEPLLFVYMPGQVYNYLRYDNGEVTTLLTAARQTFDNADRAQTIVAAQEIYEQGSTVIPLLANYTVTFLNNRLTGAITSLAYWSMPQMAYVGSAG